MSLIISSVKARLKNSFRSSKQALLFSAILIGLCHTLLYFSISNAIYENATTARLMNRVGKQRMFSQRVLFLCSKIQLNQNATEARVTLRQVLDTLASTNAQFVKAEKQKPLGSKIQDLLFSKPESINITLPGLCKRVEDFLSMREPILQKKSFSQIITFYENHRILETLDNIVTEYETEAKRKIENARNVCLVMSLSMLAAEILVLCLFASHYNTKVFNYKEQLQSTKEKLETEFRHRQELEKYIVSLNQAMSSKGRQISLS